MAKNKRIWQGLPLRILQLNVEGCIASKLNIVERLATHHNYDHNLVIMNKNNIISDYEQVPCFSDKNCLAEICILYLH